MKDHVHLQTAALLRRLAVQMNRTAKSADEEAIHDLRVVIRRLSRCLRVFSIFYPGNSWKRLRRRLRTLMDAAAVVRDLDITAELVARAGAENTALLPAISEARTRAKRQLQREARLWNARGWSKKWRNALGLGV
jgi:CHAD domain-containing protein